MVDSLPKTMKRDEPTADSHALFRLLKSQESSKGPFERIKSKCVFKGPMRKAFILINTALGSESEVLSELKKIEGIVGVYEVYGVYDVVAEVEAETQQMLKEVVFSKIRTLKHVRSTLTLTAI